MMMQLPIFSVRSRGGMCRLAVLMAAVMLPAWNAASVDKAAGTQAGWPEFRGPHGNGIAGAADGAQPLDLPLEWSETENIVWKTPIPHKGWSTPVVLDGDIWLTTATGEGHDFYAVCVDFETGAVRFNEQVFHCDHPEPLGNNVNCYASPSPVIAPGRVFVHFGSYGTACLDTATAEVIWKRDDLPCRHYRGPGSSAMLYKDLLILTFDGVDVQYMAALDTKTGKTVWKTDRSTQWTDLDENGNPKREGDYRKAFSTPLVAGTAKGPQLLTVGSSAAFAYEPLTGREIWTLPLPGYTPAARPVFADGVAYITSGRGEQMLLAVRVDGQGDVAGSHVVWTREGRDIPQEPSPVLVDGLLYIVNNQGVLNCLDAATGETVWRERLGGNYVSSPIYADGRLYCCSTQGETVVLRAGRAFEVLAENRLDDGFLASPAVAGNALILRTKTHLYRIEEK